MSWEELLERIKIRNTIMKECTKKKWFDLTPEELEEIERRHEERMRWWLIAIGPFLPIFGIWVVWFLQRRGYEPFKGAIHTLIGAFYQAAMLTILLNVIASHLCA